MTNTDMNAATDTATPTVIDTEPGIVEAALDATAPHTKGSKKHTGLKKNKGTKKSTTQRRVAKTLAYFALIFTGLAVLAEPWLLIPVAALMLAISLWD
ncbi:hypothetical protein ACQF36_27920 [Streptomyces sp. Marseille-Q5077]|uniref:hypothetical protein n=1 Tax=Streptomyces sp. Marseille-Q5077 TaxID=3418995 RepID=UPI003D012662